MGISRFGILYGIGLNYNSEYFNVYSLKLLTTQIMNPQIQNDFLKLIGIAITDQRVIQIKHNSIWRTIEPYMAGLHKETQVPSLYGFCRDVIPTLYKENDERWQIFRFTEIEDIELTYYEFQPHLGYTGKYESIQPAYIKLAPRS